MDIQGLGLSTSIMSNSNTGSALGMRLLDKALDMEAMNGDVLTQMLERSVNPLVGQNIDIRI